MKTNHPGIYMRKPEKEFHPIKDKSVYIIFHGKALGDTLAFFPYVEQFRIENRCRVKVYLPKQEMIQYFKPVYPEIEFLPEGSSRLRFFIFEDGTLNSLATASASMKLRALCLPSKGT